MSNRRRFRPAVERLEEIIAPALTAHLRGHTLLITDTPSDTAAAQVSIEASDEGQVAVSLGANDEEPQLFDGVRKIRVVLRNTGTEEADTVAVGELGPHVQRLYIATGNGDSEVTVTGGSYAAVDIVGGAGVDAVTFAAGERATIVRGRVRIDTRGGDDAVTLAGATGSTVGGLDKRSGLLVRLGAGNDALAVEGISVGGATRINGGDGDNIVTVAGFLRNASYFGGRGVDTLDVSALTAQRVHVNLGPGDDLLTVSEGTEVGGGVVNGGRGVNTLEGGFSESVADAVASRRLRVLNFVEPADGGEGG